MINSIRKTWLDKIKLPILVSAAFALFLSGGMPAGLTSKSVSAAGLSGSKHPSVIYTSLENRSRGILLNSKVSVTFNEAMDRNAFTPVSSYMKGPDGTVISGTISFNALDSTFTFVPSNALATGTRYTFTFTKRIKSAGGARLLRTYSFSFTTIGDFIYAAQGNGNVSSWSVYGGRLSSSPLSVGSGEGADSVAVDPSGKYLYTADSNMGMVSSYSINNGVLSRRPLSTTERNSGFTPYHLAVDPSGNFIYVTDWSTGTVSSFSVNNGMLSPNPVGVTAPTSSSFKGAIDVIVDPSGRYLYVDGGTGDATNGFQSLSSYSISNGILSPLSSASNYSSQSRDIAENAESIVLSGNLIFAAEDGYGYISSYSVKGGMVKYTGNSTAYDSSAAGEVFLAVDPSGKHLFASYNNPGNIVSYSIGDNGTLTKLSETAIGYGRLANPNYIIVDPSGRYLYVTYYSTGNLAAYSIKDGMLSADPVSEIGNANATLSGDYSSIAITPLVYQRPEWKVYQTTQPNSVNKGVENIKKETKPVLNFFQNLLK